MISKSVTKSDTANSIPFRLHQKPIVALTGATGFIGTALIDVLIAAGWSVRALYRPKKGRVQPKLPHLEWLQGELDHDPALDILVDKADAVIHCAGAVRGATQADFDRVNENGALSVAKATMRIAPQAKFLLLSSLAAREPSLSFYSGSKWRGEQAIKSVSNGLQWTIIRPPAVYGPGDRELLPLFRSIAKGLAPLPAAGKQRFSMIYVDDLSTAIVKWLSCEVDCKQTFELDDGRIGGYNWDTVLDISEQTLRNGAHVRRILIPITVLKIFFFIYMYAARLLNYAPMLTPGKIRELTHPNWLSEGQEFSRITGWQPRFQLDKGLDSIFNLDSSIK